METLIPLGDARARDPEIAGHKAAELARAAAAGMPVLSGWVLPLKESAAALAVGSAAGRVRSPATSVLAVSSAELDDRLRPELASAVASMGGSVVVRSSSPLEADPHWCGAFATYLDVGIDDVEAAVRGCWASVFTRDALARGAHLHVDPAAVGVAVLIQPWMAFVGGGVAAIEPDGGIAISATRGAPADLVSGRDAGVSIRVSADGTSDGDALPEGFTSDMVGSVGRLMRRVRESLGDDTIEWGWASGGVALLQAGRSRPGTDVAAPAPSPRRRRYPPVAARLALAAASYPGSFGERWVLPWAFALDRLPRPAPVDVHDVAAAVSESERLSSELGAWVWDVAAHRVEAETGSSFRAILGPDPFDELARLSTFRPPDPARAARLLGLLSAIGEALPLAGRLPAAGRHRWEPFVFSVAEDRGRALVGRSAAPGIGAGPSFVLDGSSWVAPPPRRVLVVSAAVPQLASLLWDAAGLVARSGSAGAHLFEVARSLGVPAVIGVDLGDEDGRVVAVNGHDGTVSVLEPGRRGACTMTDQGRSMERRTG
jgi:hypothetical protein